MILGVDYGTARTGLARSDGLGLYAVGIGNIKSYDPEKAAIAVAEQAEAISADTIVIGRPLNMNGTVGEKSLACEHFGELVASHTNIPIVFQDERLSTVEAHRILTDSGIKAKNRKNIIDSLAAEIILQNYIDYIKNTSKQ